MIINMLKFNSKQFYLYIVIVAIFMQKHASSRCPDTHNAIIVCPLLTLSLYGVRQTY